MKEYIVELLQIADQLKVFHLQTTSYAEHKALNKAYDSIAELTDDFTETYMGKYGRFQIGDGDDIVLQNYSPALVRKYADECVSLLGGLYDQLDPSTDADLQNIVADMLGTMNRLKYLLTLN